MSRRSRSASTDTGRAAVPQVVTPHRPVVSVALVLFVPALWLVHEGDLSAQTALVRFIGALLVSWLAAQLILAPVSRYAKPPARPDGARDTGPGEASGPGSVGASGSVGVVDRGGPDEHAGPAGRSA